MLHYCGLLKNIFGALFLPENQSLHLVPFSFHLKTSFRISFSAELRVTNSRSFFLYQNVCMFVFIFETRSHSNHGIPLASGLHYFHDKPESIWIIRFPLSNVLFLSGSFQIVSLIVSLSVWCLAADWDSLGIIFFIFTLFWICWISWMFKFMSFNIIYQQYQYISLLSIAQHWIFNICWVILESICQSIRQIINFWPFPKEGHFIDFLTCYHYNTIFSSHNLKNTYLQLNTGQCWVGNVLVLCLVKIT